MARKTYSPEFKFTIVLEAEQYELYAKIGKLTASNDWLKKNWRNCRGIRKSCKVCLVLV